VETCLWVLQLVVSLVGVGAWLVLVYHCSKSFRAWRFFMGWFWLSWIPLVEGFRDWAYFLFPLGYLVFLVGQRQVE